jgi:RNA polymerase sigma-70 factor (ECF subfamily)
LGDSDIRFVEVYEHYHRAVFVYCRRRVSADRVDDVVADTFLTAWRKIDQIPAGDEALPWLYSVAYRVLLHQWRGTSRRKRLDDRLLSLGVDSPTAPEEFIVSTHESKQVLDATSKLKATDQEILRLSLWEELAHTDVASVLDLNVDAVRKRLSRALQNLTKEFNRTDGKRSQSPAAQQGGA